MSSSFNGNIRFTIFGQSHSPAIGVTVEGLPAGFEPDMSELARFMQRRAPGRSEFSTPRSEADAPEFISGLFDGRLCGTPLTAIIKNTNTRSGDYSELKYKPRPGHADFTAGERYNNSQDYTGGGHFSGRLTAPLCIVGGLCLQLLRAEGISVVTRIAELGGIADEGEICATADKPFPVVNDECGEKMKAAILSAKAEGNSVGALSNVRYQAAPPVSATQSSAAWKTAYHRLFSAYRQLRALSLAQASAQQKCSAAKTTTPSPWKTAG